MSYVAKTENPDEYMTQNGPIIEVIRKYGTNQNSKELSNTDKENGIVWENNVGIKAIINKGEE